MCHCSLEGGVVSDTWVAPWVMCPVKLPVLVHWHGVKHLFQWLPHVLVLVLEAPVNCSAGLFNLVSHVRGLESVDSLSHK